MKKIALVSAIMLGGLFTQAANAQIGINLGLRLGSHRIISPVAEVVQAPADYYAADDFYYLPDLGAYYSVAEQCYYYNDGINWVSAAYLPGYRDYDWRNARRFEVRARRPYLNDNFYRSRYEGHANNFGRAENRVYADRNFDRGGYRNDGYRNENNRDFNNDNRMRDDSRNRGFNQPQPNNRQPENFGGRERGSNFSQPMQPDRNADRQNGRGFNQPAQPNMNRGNMEQSTIGGRERGGYNGGQQVPANDGQRNQNQPSMGGRERGGNNGGAQQAPVNHDHGNQAQPSNGRGGSSNYRGDTHITDNQMHGNVTRFARS